MEAFSLDELYNYLKQCRDVIREYPGEYLPIGCQTVPIWVTVDRVGEDSYYQFNCGDDDDRDQDLECYHSKIELDMSDQELISVAKDIHGYFLTY